MALVIHIENIFNLILVAVHLYTVSYLISNNGNCSNDTEMFLWARVSPVRLAWRVQAKGQNLEALEAKFDGIDCEIEIAHNCWKLLLKISAPSSSGNCWHTHYHCWKVFVDSILLHCAHLEIKSSYLTHLMDKLDKCRKGSEMKNRN